MAPCHQMGMSAFAHPPLLNAEKSIENVKLIQHAVQISKNLMKGAWISDYCQYEYHGATFHFEHKICIVPGEFLTSFLSSGSLVWQTKIAPLSNYRRRGI